MISMLSAVFKKSSSQRNFNFPEFTKMRWHTAGFLLFSVGKTNVGLLTPNAIEGGILCKKWLL